jgi:hypothetical protein
MSYDGQGLNGSTGGPDNLRKFFWAEFEPFGGLES